MRSVDMKQRCKGVLKRHPLLTPGGGQEMRILGEPNANGGGV